jgi:hypothetical protein
MYGTGFLAKVSGLRTTAKVAVAATAATLTMTAAVAAAVVLPSGGGDSGSAVMQSATLEAGALDAATSTTAAETEGQADAGASVPTAAGSAPTTANAGAGGRAAASTPLASVPIPSIPTSIPLLGGALPDLATLTDIPAKVMSCLAPVFALVTSMPSVPSPTQIAQIGPSIVSCVSGIVAGLPLPSGLNACISEIMGFVSGVTSQIPTGIPDFGDLDVAACIPSGLPVPTGASSFMGGGFPFGR